MKRLKKILCMALVSALVVGLIPVSVGATGTTQFAGGDGTEENPYLVETVEQFNAIRENLSANYKIISSIDMQDFGRWVPIGSVAEPFSGSVDGGGYKITNLTIGDCTEEDVQHIGLFAVTKDASLKNITLDSVNTETPEYKVYSVCAGILIARDISDSHTYIENCHITGKLSVNTVNQVVSSISAGGFVGEGIASIKSSSFKGEIDIYSYGSARDEVGGAVGAGWESSIINFTYSGTIRVTSNQRGSRVNLGGIGGNVSNVNVSGCIVNAELESGCHYDCYPADRTSSFTTGGVAGTSRNSTIKNTEVVGNIKSLSDYGSNAMGGLVGDADGIDILNCNYTGKMDGTSAYSNSKPAAGGIIGDLGGESCIIKNSSADSDINNRGYYHSRISTGGLIGYTTGYTEIWISDCVTTGVLSASAYDTANPTIYTGGIVGCVLYASGSKKHHISGTSYNTDYPLQGYPSDSSNWTSDEETVRFLNSWDATTHKVTFGDSSGLISPYTYTVADSVDTSNISDLLNKYVLVAMEQGDSVLEYIVTDIQPVESAIGEATATDEHSLTINGTMYPVREDYILGSYESQKILYHIRNGIIMGFDVLEEKAGTLEAWDSTTGQATIDGTVYPTNYLSDLSFQNDLDQYMGQKIKYSVSGNNDYKPLIRIDALGKAETDIAVFSTEKSLTVQTGDSMWLGFGKFSDGQLAGDWAKMAVVVSDPTVISLSDYEETEYGYSLEVKGKKQGATNVTITDTESGASTIIVITVRDSYVGTYSYAIDRMDTFYPSNEWEGSIQTNIYNLNGLYINNYQANKVGTDYTVSFDVYNSQYHTGAVDIYDADGNWIDCEEIKKFSMISSLWDTGEQAYYLISDAVNGKLLTYEQASFAEHTSISIEVPDGGYFAISNNFAELPGAFLFNSCDIIFDGTCTLIDAALDVKNDKVAVSAFSDLVKKEITKDKAIREQFIDIFKKTAKKEAQKCLKKFAINEIDERYTDISGVFENLLNSLDINWKHLFKSATGVGESVFTKFAGPAGVALKGCFAFTKGGNQLVQAVHLAASIDAPYVTVFSSISEGDINPHGVIVNTNGNVDAEAVLQVFRVSNNNTIEVILDGDGDDHLKKYELYNICFVKDDQLVQPSGRVTVRIPIPDGMKSDTCNVYRQEADGSWTILTAHIEGNYLVFETDHFSLYGIVGNLTELEISSLPSKTQYKVGDILNPDGLTISLDGELITKGFICDPMVLSQSGTQKITVRYGLASAEFDVSVLVADEDEGSGGGSSGGGGSTGGGSSGSGTSTPSNPTTDDTDTPSKPDKPTPLDFTDVTPSTWYKEAVQYVVENGLMSGYGNKKFGPNDSLTRAQFAQILYNNEGRPTIKVASEFNDVPSSAWYYDAVTWAADNGVVSGYGNGKYGPNDNITREQLAVMLWRYAGKPESSHSLTQFSDESKISDFAQEALAWANENGIVSGKGNGILDPLGKATRAEVAAMLMRYLTKTVK